MVRELLQQRLATGEEGCEALSITEFMVLLMKARAMSGCALPGDQATLRKHRQATAAFPFHALHSTSRVVTPPGQRDTPPDTSSSEEEVIVQKGGKPRVSFAQAPLKGRGAAKSSKKRERN